MRKLFEKAIDSGLIAGLASGINVSLSEYLPDIGLKFWNAFKPEVVF